MVIVKKITKNEDGTYSAQWALDADQMAFLVTYAVNDLLRHGLLQVDEASDEFEDKQTQFDFLKELSTEEMGKAQ